MTNKELLESLVYEKTNYEPKASTGDYEAFISGSIYRDFLEEMKVRIADMKQYYEKVDSKEFLETRGGLKAMRLVASIFEDLYANAKSDLEREK